MFSVLANARNLMGKIMLASCHATHIIVGLNCSNSRVALHFHCIGRCFLKAVSKEHWFLIGHFFFFSESRSGSGVMSVVKIFEILNNQKLLDQLHKLTYYKWLMCMCHFLQVSSPTLAECCLQK